MEFIVVEDMNGLIEELKNAYKQYGNIPVNHSGINIYVEDWDGMTDIHGHPVQPLLIIE